MSKLIPIHEVFLGRARAIGHMFRIYGWESYQGFRSDENMTVEQTGAAGSINLRYWRKLVIGHKHRQAYIYFEGIQATDPTSVEFGPETTTNQQVISVRKEPVVNHGFSDIQVKFDDVFGKTTGDDTSKTASGGGSVKTTIEEEAGVEGVEKFKASLEVEVHAEYSETKSHSEGTSHDAGSGEETEVPPGKAVSITETRSRADTSQEVSAHGNFTHAVEVGQYTHKVKPNHKWGNVKWDSWGQFLDVFHGEAPDNWPMAPEAKKHVPFSKDMMTVERPLSAPLKYRVRFEGVIINKYDVEPLGDAE